MDDAGAGECRSSFLWLCCTHPEPGHGVSSVPPWGTVAPRAPVSQHCSPCSCSSQTAQPASGEREAADQELLRCCCSFLQGNCKGIAIESCPGETQAQPEVCGTLADITLGAAGLLLPDVWIVPQDCHSPPVFFPLRGNMIWYLHPHRPGSQVSEGISMGSLCRAGGALFLAAVPWAIQLQLGLVGPWQHRNSRTNRNLKSK